MKMRLATYNVNNLFRRARVLQLPGMNAESREILQDFQQLTDLLRQPAFAGATGTEILRLVKKYELHFTTLTQKNQWFFLNTVRGKLLTVRRATQQPELVAAGPEDWLGWVEMRREVTNAVAQDNTARVLAAVNADVVGCVEVEDRVTLAQFNQELLSKFTPAYPHNLLVDGNDTRGIDVAVLSRFPVRSLRSHIDDPDPDDASRRVFSRDCPEFELRLPNGRPLWILVNHFKSKGYGSPASSDAKRTQQAQRVREILARFRLDRDLVAVMGDLNDFPDRPTLAPLLTTPHLHDVLASPLLGGPDWTYHDKKRLDYLLVSKPLFSRLQAVGIERRGIFFKNDPNRFPEVVDAVTQASDHAAVWAEFKV